MKEVFKWVEQYGNTIFSQLRRIGSSLDWSRQVRGARPKNKAIVPTVCSAQAQVHHTS